MPKKRNLRHGSLQKNDFDIPEKFQYPIHNIKREILGQKIKVKKLIKIYFSKTLSMFNISNITGYGENYELSFGVNYV